MQENSKEKQLVEELQKTGLNPKEATVYFRLLKSGSRGSLVRELMHDLVIERTSIYAILRKFVKRGIVTKTKDLETTKQATIFTAIPPKHYLSQIIESKENAIKKLKQFEKKYGDQFEEIYYQGLAYSVDEFDSFIQPYLKPLIEQGWKVRSYNAKKNDLIFNHTVYDILIESTTTRYIKINGFLVLTFYEQIEHDQSSLNFFINAFKNHTRNEILFHTKLQDFTFEDNQINFRQKEYPGFNMKLHINNKNILKNFSQYFDLNGETKVEISVRAVALPIQNKLFLLWAETRENLEKMLNSIFQVENMIN